MRPGTALACGATSWSVCIVALVASILNDVSIALLLVIDTYQVHLIQEYLLLFFRGVLFAARVVWWLAVG